MLSDAQYDFIADGCEDMELDAIWDYFSKPFGSPFLPLDLRTFEDRRDAFLWVLERLLREGRIVLIRLGTQSSIGGDISDQVRRFLEAFPKTDGEMDGGLWFFSPSCPGGAAWQRRS
ncbi:DUF596 domain-containing protein [Cupriavidus sp. YAF13]